MAHITSDRVSDTSTTTGTGNVTVSGTAPTGYRTFSTVCAASDTFWYCIAHQTADEWEVGYGTYSSANVLARTTVLSSSNAGSAVNFSAGTKNVFLTIAAGRTQINVQTFAANGTWTKPAGFSPSSRVLIQAWGGGGSGCKHASTGGGGGGGGYNERWLTLSELSGTETVTIGAGGVAISAAANGNVGANTTFGSLVAAYGGGGGGTNIGGGGGGQFSVGASTSTTFADASKMGGMPGQPITMNAVPVEAGSSGTFGGFPQGAGGATLAYAATYRYALWHGGGGASTTAGNGAATTVKGGGGGGASSTNTTGGTSSHGGAGGAGAATGTAGTAPGGGGGGSTTGNSGAGAAGQVIATVFPG